MAEKIKFYRGAAGTSLPNTRQNGAIFIVERENSDGLGDIYVDISPTKRIRIIPEIILKEPGATDTIQPISTINNTVSSLAVAAPGTETPQGAVTYYEYDTEKENLSLYQLGINMNVPVTLGPEKTFKTEDSTYELN